MTKTQNECTNTFDASCNACKKCLRENADAFDACANAHTTNRAKRSAAVIELQRLLAEKKHTRAVIQARLLALTDVSLKTIQSYLSDSFNIKYTSLRNANNERIVAQIDDKNIMYID